MGIVIYGPQGCGKSLNKDALAKHFGMTEIIEEWTPGDPLPENALALTNVPGVDGAVKYSNVIGLLVTE